MITISIYTFLILVILGFIAIFLLGLVLKGFSWERTTVQNLTFKNAETATSNSTSIYNKIIVSNFKEGVTLGDN